MTMRNWGQDANVENLPGDNSDKSAASLQTMLSKPMPEVSLTSKRMGDPEEEGKQTDREKKRWIQSRRIQ